MCCRMMPEMVGVCSACGVGVWGRGEVGWVGLPCIPVASLPTPMRNSTWTKNHPSTSFGSRLNRGLEEVWDYEVYSAFRWRQRLWGRGREGGRVSSVSYVDLQRRWAEIGTEWKKERKERNDWKEKRTYIHLSRHDFRHFQPIADGIFHLGEDFCVRKERGWSISGVEVWFGIL